MICFFPFFSLLPPSVHHIFFDDNIHNDATDSIVAARWRPTAKSEFKPVSGEGTLALQGIHLVRVPTLEPILDHDWFLKQIDSCEAWFADACQQRASAKHELD
jgi:hypothetical protein